MTLTARLNGGLAVKAGQALVHDRDGVLPASATANDSGIQPIEYRALVMLDEAPKKIGSIHIPDAIREREQTAAVDGVLVAHGGLAFTVDGEPWPEEDTPKVGERVTIAKYAGLEREVGGRVYRIVNDKDIVAILR